MAELTNITADAMALQERDEFREQGWVKLVSPAKVNLHLAIGRRREDGYHEAATVLHALNLHDVVYMRHKLPGADEPSVPTTRLVALSDVPVPDVPSNDNLATKAVRLLAERLGKVDAGIEIRIEKSVPAQGGLGGGSSNAAAALVGAARLWGVPADDPAIEETACRLGSDVAFFLHGGCSYYEGTGEVFVRALEPSKKAVALVKPAGGVPTAEAYRAFDGDPQVVPDDLARQAQTVARADEITLFNNLAPAAEGIMSELAEIRAWLVGQDGVQDTLLCGSGSTTFAVCDDFATTCDIVAAARKRGLWARATSFGSIRVMAVPAEGDAEA